MRNSTRLYIKNRIELSKERYACWIRVTYKMAIFFQGGGVGNIIYSFRNDEGRLVIYSCWNDIIGEVIKEHKERTK